MEVEKGEIITLSDNKEYICLSTIIAEDNRKFLYLVKVSEPIEFCFVEQTTTNDLVQMRKVGKRDEKKKLFNLLKAQSQNNSNQELRHV